MGGSPIAGDWELSPLSNRVRTVALVGRTGNGKSATGNSILGKHVFTSLSKSSGTTKTCELHGVVCRNGQRVNVIDTPGLFDSSTDFGNEILKCIELAKDGIHAILVVFSARGRFSNEEEDALLRLKILFGNNIVDYIIVVFTGGDELRYNEQTLDSYLGSECPASLKDFIRLCMNRIMLFNNRTSDEREMSEQVRQLLELVDHVIEHNGGQPFTNDIFLEFKRSDKKRESEEDLLGRITQMFELKLSEAIQKLEQELEKEHVARRKAAEDALAAQTKLNEQVHKLSKESEGAHQQALKNAQDSNEKINKLTQELQKTKEQAEKMKEEADKFKEEARKRWYCAIM